MKSKEDLSPTSKSSKGSGKVAGTTTSTEGEPGLLQNKKVKNREEIEDTKVFAEDEL